MVQARTRERGIAGSGNRSRQILDADSEVGLRWDWFQTTPQQATSAVPVPAAAYQPAVHPHRFQPRR
jgi:hypothetical protein